MKSRSPLSAFTLIELLVVIAVLSILGMLLFSALGGTREKGHMAASASNLRQWVGALHASISDNNGLMPSDGTSGGAGNLDTDPADPTAWYNVLPRYIQLPPLMDKSYIENPIKPESRSLWVNPMIRKEQAQQYVGTNEKHLFSYAMNTWLSDETNRRQMISSVAHPSTTVFMGEKGDGSGVLSPEFVKAWFGSGDPLTGKENAAHFVFFDGHVDLVKRSIFDPRYSPNTATESTSADSEKINEHFSFIPYQGALP